MSPIFKPFEMQRLFNIASSKHKFNAINVTLSEDCSKGHPYVVRTNMNNGIKGYIDEDPEQLNPANTFSFGQDTATVFWQDKAYFTGDKIKILEPKYFISNEVALYILTSIRKSFVNFLWGRNSFDERVIKGMQIMLPVIANEEGEPLIDDGHKYSDYGYIPDYNYMLQYIESIKRLYTTELKHKRMVELERYLIASKLNDYSLSKDDNQVLLIRPIFKEFRCGDIFTAQTGDIDLQQKDINGRGCFFVNSGVDNCGIKGKTDKPARIFPANTITIDFWGNAYYRDYEYKMATHNHVFSLSGDVIKNEEVGLYLTSQMSYMRKIFSFHNMGTWNRIKELHIMLPVKTDEKQQPISEPNQKYHPDGYVPDWQYMVRYIKCVEKQVIADVVSFKDQAIAQTKAIVSDHV